MHLAFPMLAFIDGLGGPEMMMVFVLVLLLFGGQKLPEFARGLGKTMREFKKAAAGVEDEFKRALDEDERKKSQVALAAAPVVPALTAASIPETGTTTSPDPHHDYSQHDSYHDHYAEGGPESPASSPAPTTDETVKQPATNVSPIAPTPPAASPSQSAAALPGTATTPNASGSEPTKPATPVP